MCRQLRDYPLDTQLLATYRRMRTFYKKLLNKKKKNFQQGLLTRLENLEGRDPKLFWDIYNELTERESKQTNPISPSKWLD